MNNPFVSCLGKCCMSAKMAALALPVNTWEGRNLKIQVIAIRSNANVREAAPFSSGGICLFFFHRPLMMSASAKWTRVLKRVLAVGGFHHISWTARLEPNALAQWRRPKYVGPCHSEGNLDKVLAFTWPTSGYHSPLGSKTVSGRSLSLCLSLSLFQHK